MKRLCQLIGVSTSGYYAWRVRPVSEQRCYDLKLLELMKELHQGLRKSYGQGRLHRKLVKAGRQV